MAVFAGYVVEGDFTARHCARKIMQTFKGGGGGGADDAILHNITCNIVQGVWVTLIHVLTFRYNFKSARNENFYLEKGRNKMTTACIAYYLAARD